MLADLETRGADVPVHVAAGDAPSILGALLLPGINLAIWERALPAGLSAVLDALDFGDVEFVRFTADVGNVAREMRLAFEEAGCRQAGLALLAADIAALAERYARVMDLPSVEIRLEQVTGNACRRFHADYVTARMITTYSGPGTEWLDAQAAAHLAAGVPPAPHRVRTLGTGAVAMFKGRTWAPRDPIIHRSPPITGTGRTRLVLVVDPAGRLSGPG
ncbi:DUF1826 domain-containing protein [Sphingomonas sp. dw_22]|uniref:DUF1826 domain-containing protein n=1 Tax=Sphingomonas sp. dw_22 TaxID=2721175 RepID=UPI001BD5A777|nr:DUF1826 domain-containing protein [Sphingomonas sp. dw_22]